MIPRIPPVTTTQSFGDIATATRIESIENARLINSTRTTVAQNGDSPSIPLALRRLTPIDTFFLPEEVRIRQIQQIKAAEQLHQREPNQIDGEQRRQNAERKAAQQPIAQRLLMFGAWKTQDHDGHDQRVVGAEEAFEGDEQGRW